MEEVLRGHGSETRREFDPGTDPIVRVQARRLRSKMERYYQAEGCDEPIRIEYPVGGYTN